MRDRLGGKADPAAFCGRGPFLLGPIFSREWLTVPRQARHYWLRVAYIGLLWVLGLTIWQVTVGWTSTPTLGDSARFSTILFRVLTLYVNLPLLLFFSALSAASAVAREKDRRTFILLLMTDLRDYEIVLGKILGSLLQIAILLAAMIPILAMLLLMGGIDPEQIWQATIIMGGTALAAGSLGGLMALWCEKTFPALALTVLGLVLYLCLVLILGFLPWTTDWPSWLNPFVALQAVLEPDVTGESARIAAYGFTGSMLLCSVLLNVWGIMRLRVWNPSGEPIMQRETPTEEAEEDKDRARAHAAPGTVRDVWENPIIWREVRTRGYGRRPFLVKSAYFLVLALLSYVAYDSLRSTGGRDPFVAGYGLIPVSILSLLLVGAQAVTAITSERDTGALDLLLVTDLTPQEFIFGKLGGIFYNTKEFLIPPLLIAFIYAFSYALATPGRLHPEYALSMNIEALLCIDLGLLLVMAFSAVLGIHVALRNVNSQVAIINSLGTLFFLTAGTGICIALILINGRFEAQWSSFILFGSASIGGLWWVLNGERPSAALTLASWLCPPAVFYAVTNVLVGKPGTEESADPLVPFVVIVGAFGFTIAAMLVPLLSEFDVALGRTTGGQE